MERGRGNRVLVLSNLASWLLLTGVSEGEEERWAEEEEIGKKEKGKTLLSKRR